MAYVSYNALPGGRVREALRDMLVFHTAELADPRERVAQARGLLRFLVEGAPERARARGVDARPGRALLARSDATLLHDELAEVNDAVYFHEFAAHAARHGLQYLAEADFFEMQIGAASEPAAQALLAIDDPVRREQYLDFLKARMFRQTLLCRAELAIDRTPAPRCSSASRCDAGAGPQGEPGADGAQAFEGPTGSTLTTDHPLVVDALRRAATRGPPRRGCVTCWAAGGRGPTGPRCATRCCAATRPTSSSSTCTRRG